MQNIFSSSCVSARRLFTISPPIIFRSFCPSRNWTRNSTWKEREGRNGDLGLSRASAEKRPLLKDRPFLLLLSSHCRLLLLLLLLVFERKPCQNLSQGSSTPVFVTFFPFWKKREREEKCVRALQSRPLSKVAKASRPELWHAVLKGIIFLVLDTHFFSPKKGSAKETFFQTSVKLTMSTLFTVSSCPSANSEQNHQFNKE